MKKFYVMFVIACLLSVFSYAKTSKAVFQFDSSTKYLGTSTTDEMETNEGNIFSCSYIDADLDTAENYQTWAIENSTSALHAVIKVLPSQAGTFYMYENTNLNTNGTEVSCYNQLRSSSDTLSGVVYWNSNVYETGTQIFYKYIPANVELEKSVVLKPSEDYFFKFVPLSDNTQVDFEAYIRE